MKEEVIIMADMAVNEKEVFEYTYSSKQQEEIEKIRNKYLPKQESKMEQLRKLDKSTEQPGTITGIAVGTVGALIMGMGMSLTMTDLSVFFGLNEITAIVVGIVIGIIGMAAAGVAYPLYVSITKKQRAKVAEQILKLSEELSL